MTIQQWFQEKGTYSEGVALYEASGFANARLLKLFLSRQNQANSSKLRTELFYLKNKVKDVTIEKSATSAKYGSVEKTQNKNVTKKTKPRKVNDQKLFLVSEQNKFLAAQKRKLDVASLPVELREINYKKNQAYNELFEMKVQLLESKHLTKNQRLVFILKMHNLWKFIDKCWMQIDFYKENGRLFVEPIEDFGEMSYPNLIKKRQRLYEQISKREKSLKQLLESLPRKSNKQLGVFNQAKVNKKQLEIDKRKILCAELSERIKKYEQTS